MRSDIDVDKIIDTFIRGGWDPLDDGFARAISDQVKGLIDAHVWNMRVALRD